MIKKYGDIYSGIFFFVFGILLFISSFSIKRLTVSRVGAAFVPQIVAVIFVVLSIIVIVNGVKKAKNYDTASDSDDKVVKDIKEKNYAPFYTILLLIIYVALLEKIGFIIMSSLFLFMQFIVLSPKSKRKYVLFGILSVVISILVYYFFVNVFHLMLPKGILK